MLGNAVVTENPLFEIHHQKAFVHGGENEIELFLLRLEAVAAEDDLIAETADFLAEVRKLHGAVIPEGVEGKPLLLFVQQRVEVQDVLFQLLSIVPGEKMAQQQTEEDQNRSSQGKPKAEMKDIPIFTGIKHHAADRHPAGQQRNQQIAEKEIGFELHGGPPFWYHSGRKLPEKPKAAQRQLIHS